MGSSSGSSSSQLYDSISSQCKEYLQNMYRQSNNQLVTLLSDVHELESFSMEHLREVGWAL
jgi:hypothetical protein